MTDFWTEDEGAGRPEDAVPFKSRTLADERREQLRAEELEHLTKLRDRVQRGMDRGDVDLASGAEMLLNISKARMSLSGVGYYPGAW
jgi:hypothetical protein